MDSKIKTFLSEMKTLHFRNQQIKEEKEKRGENYNVFTTLGLWSEEVRLHSAFISNLMNPNETHGLNAEPLKLFIELLKLKDCNIPDDLDFNSVTVNIEKFIGKVDNENKTGGRLDIEIIFEKNQYAVVIENKIYADDQPLQLVRYKNYLEKKYPDRFCLCYLTLDGKSPSKDSTNLEDGEEPYWIEISYSNDIGCWLSKCVLVAVRVPLIREVLVQYKNLIDKLSGNTIEENMKEEYMNYLLDGDNLCVVEEISYQIDAAKVKLIERDLIPFLSEFAKTHYLEFNPYNEEKDFGCEFITKDNLKICFRNDNYCYRNFYYSIEFKDNVEPYKGIREAIISFYKNENVYRSTKQCPMYSYMDNRNWTAEVLVHHMDKVIKEIKDKTLQIIEDLEFIKKDLISKK